MKKKLKEQEQKLGYTDEKITQVTNELEKNLEKVKVLLSKSKAFIGNLAFNKCINNLDYYNNEFQSFKSTIDKVENLNYKYSGISHRQYKMYDDEPSDIFTHFETLAYEFDNLVDSLNTLKDVFETLLESADKIKRLVK